MASAYLILTWLRDTYIFQGGDLRHLSMNEGATMRTRENIEKDDKGGRGCAISAQAELTDFETQLCLRNFFYCNDDDQ